MLAFSIAAFRCRFAEPVLLLFRQAFMFDFQAGDLVQMPFLARAA
jgi:hypothetical protein